jgi:imidazolonepropionase
MAKRVSKQVGNPSPRARRRAGSGRSGAGRPSGSADLRLIAHASELLTGEGIRAKDGRRVTEGDLGRVRDGALVYRVAKVKGREIPLEVVWTGATARLPREYRRLKGQDLGKRHALVPGLVDCHTHLVFAGDRADEFAARCGGASYEEIAAKGGGILSTVRATRKVSDAELLRLAEARLDEAYGFGVRTIEAKSGYGLAHESELKLLRVARKLQARRPEVTIVPTYPGAHASPPERDPESYVREICERTLPEVARKGLALDCDVFIDEGYFTVDQGRRALSRARELGLRVKVHADELADTGAAALAADLQALSADHLLKISDDGIRRLAESETTAVLLPGTAFYLRAEHAPARRLIEAGARVALSTDFNPGTCMTLNLPLIMTIAALYLRMSRAEIFAAVTYNAASALGLEETKGTLVPGADADHWVVPFPSFEEAYYRFGWSAPSGR